MVDQRAFFRNHRRDIVDGGSGGDVYTLGAARRDLMVDWMVRRGIRLDSSDGQQFHDFPHTLNDCMVSYNAHFYS